MGNSSLDANMTWSRHLFFMCGVVWVVGLTVGTRWTYVSLVEVSHDVRYVAPWPVYLGAKSLLGILERFISRSIPPGALVLRTATAYVTTASLTAVVELQVADAIAKRGGCATLDQVSMDVGVPRASVLGKTLTLLKQVGIFERRSSREGEGQIWCLNTPARLLVSTHSHSLCDAVLLLGGSEHTEATHKLTQSLLSGGVPSGFAATHGSSFWEYLAANPDRSSIFDGAMRAVEETEKRAIVAELLDLCPHLSGVIVDRDSVIDAAYTKWLTRPALAQYLEAKRISFEVGDIFVRESQLNLELSSILPGQRVAIILKHILHDWNAADSLIILRNVAKAMPAGASLILIERILDQDATFVGDQGSFISSQLMFAIFGAEERTQSEINNLVSQVGLVILDVRPTRSAVSVVLASHADT